jgi:hypothetical protein
MKIDIVSRKEPFMKEKQGWHGTFHYRQSFSEMGQCFF